MDLNQLRIFTVIAREGTLARAATTLCLSQPAVSAQLKSLEQFLQLKLFERTSRGMTITAAGRAMLDEATHVLQAADQVATRARQLVGKGVSGAFRLGTMSDPVLLRLGALIALVAHTCPHLQLSFTQGISGAVLARILERQVDAGYVIGAPVDDRICAIRIAPITLRVVAPPAWQARLAGATWQDVAAMPWLATPEQCAFRGIAARMFARHQVVPRTVIEADQETMLSDLVSQGIGLTLLRDDVASTAAAAGKVTIWSPGMETDHLYFVYLRAQEHTGPMQAILPLISQIWQPA